VSGPVLVAFLLGVFLWMLGGVIPAPTALALRIGGAVCVGLALAFAVFPLVHAG
jgi:hypothetical protein